MALTPFFNRDRSIFDPLFSDRLLDPFFSDRLFDPFSVFEHAPSRQFARDASAVANTRVDWVETPDAHVFKADLPGLKKEEIKIEVENGKILKISGERKKEETEKTDRWHRVERVQGSFLRSFRLPDDTKMDEIKAQVDHGVLTVTVPKTQQPKPEVRSIEISG